MVRVRAHFFRGEINSKGHPIKCRPSRVRLGYAMLCIYLYMNMAFWSVSWAQNPAYWVYIKKRKEHCYWKNWEIIIKAGILTLTWVVEAVANEQGWAQIWVWEREWTERVRRVKRSIIDVDFWWLVGPKKWSHDHYHIEYCPYGDSQ
jgi:hypothetical protein